MTPDLRRIASVMGGEVVGSVASFPTSGHSAKDRGSWASIVPDAPDGVLINSRNGGDPLAIKDELRAKGVLPQRETHQRALDVAAWDYTDADGVVLYRKVRTALPDGGKSYRFEHPDGRGGWKPKRGEARAAPYRLHEVAHAPADVVLYMAEGEKQADKLASWGLLATSSKDWSRHFSAYVASRTVVILPDNDEQGAKIAADAKTLVEAAGGRAVIVYLPNLAPKGDIMDWPGDVDDLRTIAEAALHEPIETFPIADLAAWANTAPQPKAFAMAGVIPANEVTLFTGKGGTNKSTFGLQLCACSAAGLPMLGVAVAAGPALYVTAEDDNRENHWRLRKIASAIGTALDRLAGKLHVVSLRGRLGNELATFDADGRLHVAPAYKLLRATIEATGSKLIVLDNVAHLFIGNENDRGHVTAFVNLLYQLCRDLDATVVLIGHPNKAGDSYSGSTAWLNAVRSQIVLERPEDSPDPDARVLRLDKANYARPDQQIAFRWHDFALIRDSDMPDDRRAELAATIAATAENARFLECLDKTVAEKRAVSLSPSAANYAPRIFVKMPVANGMKVTGFEAAMQRLLHLGTIAGDQPVYQRENRNWVRGVGRAPTLAPTMHQPYAPTRTGDATKPAETLHQPARAPDPYTYGINGAAHEAAAPFLEDRKTDLSRVVFSVDPDHAFPGFEASEVDHLPAPTPTDDDFPEDDE